MLDEEAIGEIFTQITPSFCNLSQKNLMIASGRSNSVNKIMFKLIIYNLQQHKNYW